MVRPLKAEFSLDSGYAARNVISSVSPVPMTVRITEIQMEWRNTGLLIVFLYASTENCFGHKPTRLASAADLALNETAST
ncbi:hypothetical protein D3C81_1974750 [compost metagenome]